MSGPFPARATYSRLSAGNSAAAGLGPAPLIGAGGARPPPTIPPALAPATPGTGDRRMTNLCKEVVEMEGEPYIVSVYLVGSGANKRLLFEARGVRPEKGKAGVEDKNKEGAATFRVHCVELGFSDLVYVAKVYPALLDKGKRVRELVSALRFVPPSSLNSDGGDGVEGQQRQQRQQQRKLVLDLAPLLQRMSSSGKVSPA